MKKISAWLLFAIVVVDFACAQPVTPLPDYHDRILTPPPAITPRLTGPRVLGLRPGHPLGHHLTATGERPLHFEATGLPAGLVLNPATGQLTGSLDAVGEYELQVSATNARGTATRSFKLVVGEALALTPPLGWSSWYAMGDRVDQVGTLAAAQAMVATGLADHGWSYINIDDGWQGKRDPVTHALQPSQRFPDMKQLSAQVHALGLRLGIYSGPWVTTYAGYAGGSADTPEGTWQFPAKGQRADRRFGAYTFEKIDAAQWVAWNIDFMKYDWHPMEPREAIRMAEALRGSGRDIVYSISNGANIYRREEYPKIANLWRTSNDIEDDWPTLERIWSIHAPWAPWSGPGRWADPDMLLVGHMGLKGPLRPTHLTPDEQYTHVSLWALWSAPLFVSCPLDRLDAFTLSLLSNDDVLDVDQDPLGRMAVLVAKDGPGEVWAKPLAGGGWAVGLFNRGATSRPVRVTWAQLGASGARPVRDLWRQQDLGPATDHFEATVAPHGVVLVRIAP